jgi:uncharacterized membrane protein YfcA
MDLRTILLPTLVFLVAILYSSVGFGGASSYLAVMSFFDVDPAVSATIALCLNILVAGIAFTNYALSGFLKLKVLLPFLLTSVPAAFVGGAVKIDLSVYQFLLHLVLLLVGLRIMFFPKPEAKPDQNNKHPPLGLALVLGILLGLVSGIVGIGGGIFLSPLIILAGWGSTKQAAACSAAFIVLNSISGLVGRVSGGTFVFSSFGWVLLPVGFVGGLIGSYLGARHLPVKKLQRFLAAILMIVVLRYGIGLIG